MAKDLISNGTNFSLKTTTDGNDEVPHVNVDSSVNVGTISSALPIAEIFFDNVTVTTATTQVTLGSTQALTNGITVTAQGDNTGIIFVGKSDVSLSNGIPLIAGGSVFIPADDIADVFIDATVSTEKAGFVAW